MNPELMWKSPNIIQSTESIIRSASGGRQSDSDVELKDFININTSSEIYDCSANGNSFEEKGYHCLEKNDCERSISNSSFNQFNSKLTPISKVKEYNNFNEIEPGSFVDGIFVQNTSDISSKMRHNSDQPITDEFLWFYLDPRNNVQGPFLDSQMFQWWSQGIYFQNSLLMKRKCDADFSTLQDYSKRFSGVPFNRKDIRVPPLTESLTVQSSLYTNGPMAAALQRNQHPPQHHNQIAALNDPNYIFQLMSSGQSANQSSQQDELSKMFQHKMSLQQRHPQQQPPTAPTQQQNGGVTMVTEPPLFMMNSAAGSGGGGGSLSNFVNYRLQQQQQQQQQQQSTYGADVPKSVLGNSSNYMKNDTRLFTSPSSLSSLSSWGAHSSATIQQPKLTDSVWTSTNEDTILNSNQVWSRSSANDAMGPPGGPCLLNSIFHDSQHKLHYTIPPSSSAAVGGGVCNSSHKQNINNPMQETWDNLDPAIIKMVPQVGIDQSTVDHHHQHHKNDMNISTNQIVDHHHHHHQQQQQQHHNQHQSDNSNTVTMLKHPWADLVRKGNNGTNCGGNQKSKSDFSLEHQDTGTNHSTSPNQHKTSLSSSSSEEYDQRTCDSSDKDLDQLIKWCSSYLENKPGINGVDINTLIEVLIYVESPYEVEATMRENVPEFDNICEFVKIFIEKRRPLRQRLFFSDHSKKKTNRSPTSLPQPPLSSSSVVLVKKVEDDSKWQVKTSKGSHGPSLNSSSCGKKNHRSKKNSKN